MRGIGFAATTLVCLTLAAGPAFAREPDGRRPTPAEVAHARRMVRALKDYDAQLERRMRQLKAEQRQYERRSR